MALILGPMAAGQSWPILSMAHSARTELVTTHCALPVSQPAPLHLSLAWLVPQGRTQRRWVGSEQSRGADADCSVLLTQGFAGSALKWQLCLSTVRIWRR